MGAAAGAAAAGASVLRSRSLIFTAALPVRFGFRELWIDGRDFYLNGTRIFLSALPVDNAQVSALAAGVASIGLVAAYRPYALVALVAAPLALRPGAVVLGGAEGAGLLPVLADTGRIQLAVGILLTLGIAL